MINYNRLKPVRLSLTCSYRRNATGEPHPAIHEKSRGSGERMLAHGAAVGRYAQSPTAKPRQRRRNMD